MFTRQEVSTFKTFNTICNVKRGVCIFHLILVGHRIPDFRVSTAIMLSCRHFLYRWCKLSFGPQHGSSVLLYETFKQVHFSCCPIFLRIKTIMYIYSSTKFYQLSLKNLQQFCQWVRGHSQFELFTEERHMTCCFDPQPYPPPLSRTL